MNIGNAESAYLEGTTRYDDWKIKFDLEWNQPVIEAQAAELLRNMDSATMALLKKMMPSEIRGPIGARPQGPAPTRPPSFPSPSKPLGKTWWENLFGKRDRPSGYPSYYGRKGEAPT